MGSGNGESGSACEEGRSVCGMICHRSETDGGGNGTENGGDGGAGT